MDSSYRIPECFCGPRLNVPGGLKERNFLRKVAPQADRIQDLCLRLPCHELGCILSLFSSPAPLLQSLRISVEWAIYPVERTTPISLGAPFDGDTPALRKLELINCAFPLTSPALRGLTFLRLHNLNTSFQPTLPELKVTLSYMQDLVQLHFENALPSARGNSTGQSFEDSEKLSFPQLSRLSVVAPFSTVVLLLSCFDLPMQTEVRLRCCFGAGAEDYTPIYPLLAKRFIASKYQGFALVPIIRTSFIKVTWATVSFIFSTDEPDSGRTFSAFTASYDPSRLCENWDCNIPLGIVLQTSSPKDHEDLVAGVYDSMPLISLQSAHLDLEYETTLSSDFWIKIFGHLQGLRHIRLSKVNLEGLVRVLSLAPHHRPKNKSGNLESGSSQVFAPALELDLCGVEFSKRCYARSKGNPNDCSCRAICLSDALSNRQAEGHGLRRLVVTECLYVGGQDVWDYLAESVTDFNWDGTSWST